MTTEQKIIGNLLDDKTRHITIQLTDDVVLTGTNFPANKESPTTALHLAAFAANLMQAYHSTLEQLYKEAEFSGISRERFAASIRYCFEDEEEKKE